MPRGGRLSSRAGTELALENGVTHRGRLDARQLSILLLAFVALMLGACGNQRASGQAAHSPSCPLALPGTVENVVDTEGGAAITFTAPAGQVDDVRARVRQTAQQGMIAACPCHGISGDGGAPTAMQGMRLPPADARVEDVPRGARLTLTAKNPADVDALRAHVRMHLDHLKAGCPMR